MTRCMIFEPQRVKKLTISPDENKIEAKMSYHRRETLYTGTVKIETYESKKYQLTLKIIRNENKNKQKLTFFNQNKHNSSISTDKIYAACCPNLI